MHAQLWPWVSAAHPVGALLDALEMCKPLPLAQPLDVGHTPLQLRRCRQLLPAAWLALRLLEDLQRILELLCQREASGRGRQTPHTIHTAGVLAALLLCWLVCCAPSIDLFRDGPQSTTHAAPKLSELGGAGLWRRRRLAFHAAGSAAGSLGRLLGAHPRPQAPTGRQLLLE